MMMRARLMFILCLMLPLGASAGDLVPAKNLESDAVEASRKGVPILLLYTASYCHYCAGVKAEVFFPMASDPAYQSRVVLREVQIDSDIQLRGFHGKTVDHHRFAEERGIVIVPTLEFVDDQGMPLAEPIIGSGLIDFYGHYVEQGIDSSLFKIKARRNPS